MTDYEVIDVQHIYHLLITQWINISINRYLTYHRWDPTDQSFNNMGWVGEWVGVAEILGKLGEDLRNVWASFKILIFYSNDF